jgi:Protein of unknown function (DUF5818)
MKKITLTLASLSLLFGTVSLAAVRAGSPMNASEGRSAVLQQNQASSDQQVQTFTGTISKSGDQYVLQGGSSTASYQLDDQQTASKFAGKKVTVTGTLDAASNLIHVQGIQEASS